MPIWILINIANTVPPCVLQVIPGERLREYSTVCWNLVLDIAEIVIMSSDQFSSAMWRIRIMTRFAGYIHQVRI